MQFERHFSLFVHFDITIAHKKEQHRKVPLSLIFWSKRLLNVNLLATLDHEALSFINWLTEEVDCRCFF